MRPKKVFSVDGGSALVSLRVKERHKETRDGHRTQSLTIDYSINEHMRNFSHEDYIEIFPRMECKLHSHNPH